MIYWELFLGFLKVGCFAFGGAYGAIPFIRDVVLTNGWIDEELLTYMIAVSESTPGPIMVNLATYIGNTKAGIYGALVATIAVVLPSFIIIFFITAALKNMLKNKYIQAVLRGLKPCVIGIVLATGVFMIIKNCFIMETETSIHVPAVIITVLLAVVSVGYKYHVKKKISPVMLLLIAAITGMVVYGG